MLILYSNFNSELNFENLCRGLAARGGHGMSPLLWVRFSKVSFISILYSDFGSELTFENLCTVLAARGGDRIRPLLVKILKSQLDVHFVWRL